MTDLDRRHFLAMLAAAGMAVSATRGRTAPSRARSALSDELYKLRARGNVRLLHITDTHAQLLPLYFREPDTNIGVGDDRGKLPHLVGEAFLRRTGTASDPGLVHAFTYLDYVDAARKFGRVGGFAHLKTLIDSLRDGFPGGRGNTLLLDGGDTWQGSATAMWSSGMDMVKAGNLLGIDAMTGHWEFTWGEEILRRNLNEFAGDFVAHNVLLSEEAAFDDVPAYDEKAGHVFPPYVIRNVGHAAVAIVGQAFPYTPIANPGRFVNNWRFGIYEQPLQKLVDSLRGKHGVDLVVLLSHNGMDVDLKLAARVSGIDVILGGHTHDAVPIGIEVPNRSGTTLVTAAGCSGKFVGVLDLTVGKRRLRNYHYTLLPVFSELIPPDAEMAALIAELRRPHEQTLKAELAVTRSLLYRRGNFNGTFDQLICDALRTVNGARIAFSPGFRWGTTILPGDSITRERLLDQTAISYPETYLREATGAEIKNILEDVADNLFNPDPYYRQGGDMIRSGGLRYRIDPVAPAGKRIADLTLPDGSAVSANKAYRIAGWASTNSVSTGPPVWSVVEDYLKACGIVDLKDVEGPVIKDMSGNPGIGRAH